VSLGLSLNDNRGVVIIGFTWSGVDLERGTGSGCRERGVLANRSRVSRVRGVRG
jgi:hypothetical protein